MKTPNPKTTKSKPKPKRKPREWVGWARLWDDKSLTEVQFNRYHHYNNYYGSKIIEVTVREVIE